MLYGGDSSGVLGVCVYGGILSGGFVSVLLVGSSVVV